MQKEESLSVGVLAVVTLALALATFMQVLDTTIANVSIPAISGDLGVTPKQGTWVITAFAASNAIAMPLTGWLAKRFGEVRLFIASTALFSATSLLCGLSPSFEILVIARVLQGAVAAPMMPLSQSLLLANYPHHKKGLALAFWAMTATIGPIIGPLLGGFITDNFNWSWIFYINVPVGLLSSFVVWQILKNRDTKIFKNKIDFIGLGLLIVGVASLQIMLDKGNDLDWFESKTIIIYAIIATITLSFFIVWEYFCENPIIDLKLFKSRNFTIGTIVISIGYATFLGGGVVFPLWLETVLGYSAFWAGFASAAVGVFAFLLSPVVGSNLHRMNLKVVVSISFIIFALSYFQMANFTTDIDLMHATMPRLLMGAGMAMFFVPLTSIILTEIHPSNVASAMGLVNFLRILGGGVGTSIAVTVWSNRSTYHHAIYAEGITWFSQPVQEFLTKFKYFYDGKYLLLNNLMNKQAYTRANDDILLFSAYLFLALIIVIWFAKSPKPINPNKAERILDE